MNTEDLNRFKDLWGQVSEKKKKMDPVGKADADIDNDGDVDSSDEYLHNRRKSVKRAIKQESENEIKMSKSGMNKCSECGGSTENHDEECSRFESSEKKKSSCESVRHEQWGYGEIMSESSDGVDVLFEHGVEFNVPAEQLEGVSSAIKTAKNMSGDMTGAVKKIDKQKKGMSDNPRVQKALKKANEEDEVDDAKSKVQEGTVAELEAEIEETYSALQQRAIASMKNMWEDKSHKKGATKPEGIMDKEPASSKKFAADHAKSDKDIEDYEEKGHDDATKAGRATKQAPARPGDIRKGDLKPETPKDTTKV
jgi:hypothetical protein